MLPDVNAAWLAQGRQLRNQDGQLLATLESDITAMVRLGDRLLLGLKDKGLVVVDPAEQYAVLSSFSLPGVISDLALSGESVLCIVDNQLRALHASGNTLSETPLMSELKDYNGKSIGKETFKESESAIDVQPASENGFVVLRSDSALFVDADFTVRQKINLTDPLAMVQSGSRFYVSTGNQQLVSLPPKVMLVCPWAIYPVR